jgi:hypothetical protein
VADSNTDTSGGGLTGLLGKIDPQLLASLGMGVMSSGKYGGNLGDGLMLGVQSYYHGKLAQQQLATGQYSLERQRLLTGAALREMGVDQGAPGAQAPQPGGLLNVPGAPPAAPPMAAPQGAPGGQSPLPQLTPTLNQPPPAAAPGAPQGGPSWLTPPTPADIYGRQVAGLPSPGFIRGTALLQGTNPLPELTSLREQQLKSAQQEYAPHLAKIDSLVKSDHPAQYVQADQELKEAWPILAQRLGMDPQKGLTDQNVRTAFTFGGNAIRGGLSQPIEAPNVPLITKPRGVGGALQIDPVSGKETAVPELETAQFVGPDGKVQMMTKAAGMAKGYTPYNPATFINNEASDAQAKAIASYRQPPLTGFALRSQQGQETMRKVYEQNPNYDASGWQTKQKARNSFATGKQGDITRSLSVATDHLDQLANAASALNNGNVPLANTVVNAFATGTGNPSVTNFNSMKEIVGDEVVKAVVGTTGASKDREAIKQTFSAASSPAQILGAIQKYKGLMGGQLSGLRRQYKQATGLEDFDEMLSEGARSQLPAAQAAGGGEGGNGRGPTLTYDPASGTFK